MSLSIIKNAFSFAYQELEKRYVKWFSLSLFTIGVIAISQLCGLVIQNFGIRIEQLSGVAFVGGLIVYLASLYFVLYWTISLSNVMTCNALDAVRKKPLRMLTNILHSHVLVWAPILTSVLCSLFLLPIVAGSGVLNLYNEVHFAVYWIFQVISISCLFTYYYYLLRYLFLIFIILDEQVGVSDALSKAWNLTYQRTQLLLTVIGAFIIMLSPIGLLYLLLPQLVALVSIGIYVCILWPVSILLLSSVYQQIKGRKK